ncbi:signal peptidase I [Halorubellus salinus]|uniref:signal peptidase I n=1 Tax=Halorubellus salinus TaxID=755309 RepID=UPI001D078BCF|nr:signal peptidase I [Halorubellus salinus]
MTSVRSRAVTGVVVIVVVLLVASTVGQPLLLSYVRTGSMAPTLETGDGFVAVPTTVAGAPEEGDVIIYRAQELNGGGLTTHRVVDVTERGYVTQGDANPFTDQSAGEPPVRRSQVVAVALEVGGGPLVVPALGTVVTGVRDGTAALLERVGLSVPGGSGGLWVGAAATGLVLLAFGGSAAGRERVRARGRNEEGDRTPTLSVRSIALLAAVAVVVAATASMLLPLGPVQYDVVSAESDLAGAGVIPAGESERTTYRVPGGRLFPIRYYADPASDGIAVENASGVVPPGSSANVSVTLTAPPELGNYRRSLDVHRYPVVLPTGVLDSLYRFHPLAPVVVVDLLVAIPFLLFASLVPPKRTPTGSPGATSGGRGRESGRR